MALCVEQGPAHQPGCGEILQAAQLHGQQAHHLTLHAGLLHVPVLPEVNTHPGPAFTFLSYAVFLEPGAHVTTPQMDTCTCGLVVFALQREFCLGDAGVCSAGP